MTIHKEKRVLAHRPEQLFELVADVQRYPEFLPWCVAARVRSRSEEMLVADLIIGFQMFRESFTSHVKMDKQALIIEVNYTEGPFKYLTNKWRFLPHEDGCEIDFYVDFEFNSRLLQSVIETLFTEAVRRMVQAFETRADELYGQRLRNAPAERQIARQATPRP